MNTTTLCCPVCEYENIVVSCGFCLQCGVDIEGGPDRTSDVVKLDDPTTPAQELADVVAAQHNVTTVVEPDSFAVRIRVNGRRHQVAHFAQTDDGAVCVFSICGPAIGSNALPLLQWNGQLEQAYFAARTVQGQSVFVLMSRRLFEPGDVTDARQSVLELAQLADSVESRISAGADKF